MVYPDYVGGRRHPRAGQPHPYLYAGAQHGRTRAHQYFGTQYAPQGIGIPGRTRGIAGSAGRVYPHMLYASGFRQHRQQTPSHLGNRFRRELTQAGHKAQFDMAQQRRDYRTRRSADRRKLRDINKPRKTLSAWGGSLARLAGKLGFPGPGKELARLNAARSSLMSRMGGRRTAYQRGQRRIASRGPMRVGVHRSGGRITGFSPVGRRGRTGRSYAQRSRRWGSRDYRGSRLYRRRPRRRY